MLDYSRHRVVTLSFALVVVIAVLATKFGTTSNPYSNKTELWQMFHTADEPPPRVPPPNVAIQAAQRAADIADGRLAHATLMVPVAPLLSRTPSAVRPYDSPSPIPMDWGGTDIYPKDSADTVFGRMPSRSQEIPAIPMRKGFLVPEDPINPVSSFHEQGAELGSKISSPNTDPTSTGQKLIFFKPQPFPFNLLPDSAAPPVSVDLTHRVEQMPHSSEEVEKVAPMSQHDKELPLLNRNHVIVRPAKSRSKVIDGDSFANFPDEKNLQEFSSKFLHSKDVNSDGLRSASLNGDVEEFDQNLDTTAEKMQSRGASSLPLNSPTEIHQVLESQTDSRPISAGRGKAVDMVRQGFLGGLGSALDGAGRKGSSESKLVSNSGHASALVAAAEGDETVGSQAGLKGSEAHGSRRQPAPGGGRWIPAQDGALAGFGARAPGPRGSGREAEGSGLSEVAAAVREARAKVQALRRVAAKHAGLGAVSVAGDGGGSARVVPAEEAPTTTQLADRPPAPSGRGFDSRMTRTVNQAQPVLPASHRRQAAAAAWSRPAEDAGGPRDDGVLATAEVPGGLRAGSFFSADAGRMGRMLITVPPGARAGSLLELRRLASGTLEWLLAGSAPDARHGSGPHDGGARRQVVSALPFARADAAEGAGVTTELLQLPATQSKPAPSGVAGAVRAGEGAGAGAVKLLSEDQVERMSRWQSQQLQRMQAARPEPDQDPHRPGSDTAGPAGDGVQHVAIRARGPGGQETVVGRQTVIPDCSKVFSRAQCDRLLDLQELRAAALRRRLYQAEREADQLLALNTRLREDTEKMLAHPASAPAPLPLRRSPPSLAARPAPAPAPASHDSPGPLVGPEPAAAESGEAGGLHADAQGGGVVRVRVPAGVAVGGPLDVRLPSGVVTRIQLPAGAGPGSEVELGEERFEVRVPASVAAGQPLDLVLPSARPASPSAGRRMVQIRVPARLGPERRLVVSAWVPRRAGG